VAQKTEKSSTVLLIALFKLFKGVLLVTVALGTFRLVHRDVHESLMRWAHELHVDPEGRKANAVITKVSFVQPKQLEELGAGELFYSALLLTEGIGLLMRRRWAEYFTVISTAVFLPLEIYELFERVSATRILVLLINAAIVWYLVDRIRKDKPEAALAS
jgi:uncharacterized membrane protein (DUF2068 family)